MVNNNENDIYGQVPCYVDNNNIINPYKIVEEEELKLIQGLVSCLSPERASDYSKWLSVGLCLHNLNNDVKGSGIPLADSFRNIPFSFNIFTPNNPMFVVSE